jgi:hypothetical protein
MDFFNFSPECDTVDYIPGDTRKYIFDGSIFIGGIFDGDTVLSHSLNGGIDSAAALNELSPATGPILDKEIEYWSSGILVNFDSSIAFSVKYFCPRTTVNYDFDNGHVWYQNQQFITKEIKVWSYDGQNHDDITIGEIIDWDIPSDSGVLNAGGVDLSRNMLYCVGAEFNQDDLVECQNNDLRYGGMAFGYFKRYISHSDTAAWFVIDSTPYGGFHELIPDSKGLWQDNRQLYQKISVADELTPWSRIDGGSQFADLYSVLTYVFEYDLKTGDTLVFYSLMASVRNSEAESIGTTVGRIEELADHGRNYTRYFGCCNELRGDANSDGIDGSLLDLVFIVRWVFNQGPEPICMGESDVNADGFPGDIMDMSFLVDTIFRGRRLPYSCGEPPCDFSNCHDYQ